MTFLITGIFNIIEAVLFTMLFIYYFGMKPEIKPTAVIYSFFFCIFIPAEITSVFSVPWYIALILNIFVIGLVSEKCCNGSFKEQLMLNIISNLLYPLLELFSFILFRKLMSAESSDLIKQADNSRISAELFAHVLFLAAILVILRIKKARRINFRLYKIEYVLITFTLLISMVMIGFLKNITFGSQKHYSVFLIVIFCLLFMNIGQIGTIIYVSIRNTDDQNIALMKQQLKLQEQNLNTLEEKYEITSKVRHDIKNHIACALTMAEKNDNAALIEYLSELSDDFLIPSDSYVKTSRTVLNAILNTKFEEAKRKGFDIKYVVADELENISSIDIGILLTNLLDNAIEACEKNHGHSEINLKIWHDAGYYCIELSNTVEKDILAENPHLTTSKNDKQIHGIGLKSVYAIAEKYNGMINFQQKADIFYVYVSLCR